MMSANILDRILSRLVRPDEGSVPEGSGFWERRFRLLAALILVSAFLLRIGGLAGGLPLIYHPDTMKQVNYLDQQVVRGHFPYLADGYPVGHMQVASALLAGARGLARWMGLKPVLTGHRLYVWARLVVVAFGLLGLVWIMLAGRLLFGAGVGLLAGLFWATDELTLIHSHYAMGDIPQAAMLMGVLYFSARIMRYQGWGDWLGAGLCLGLAAGIKYFGGFMLVGMATAFLLAPRRRWSLPLWGLVGAVVGFVLVTPYLLHDFATWSWELWLEFYRQGVRSLLKQEHIAGWVWYGITHSFGIWAQRSLLVPYLAPLALVALAWRRRRGDWLLLVPSLTVLFIVVVLRSNYLRDWDHLAVAPFLFLVLARGFQIAWRNLPRSWSLPSRLQPRPLLAGLMVLGLAGQAYYSVETSYLLTLPDTRSQARDWLQKRLPPARPGQVILTDDSCNTARAFNTSDFIIPPKLGYHIRLLHGDQLWWWQADLKGPKKKDVALAILHGIHGRRAMAWLETWTPPLEVFRMEPLGWHHPEIRFYEPLTHMLRIPWRPLAAYAQGWETLSPVNTPFAARLVRELVMRKGVVERTLVSDKPLPVIGLMVQGSGRLEVDQGGKHLVVTASPTRPRILDWRPRRGWPWRRYFYPLRLRSSGGHFLVRVLVSPAELAAAYARAGQGQRARDLWQQAQEQGQAILPQDRLVWASLLWQAGRKDQARRVFAPLAGSELVAAIKAAAGPVPEQQVLAGLRQGLGADARALTWRKLELNLAQAGQSVGWKRYDPKIKDQALFLPAGRPGWSKLWLGQSLTCPELLVRFWIKASPGPEEELATVDVYGHHRWKGRGVLARTRVVSKGGGGYFPVELRLRLPMLPMRLEARVNSRGQRDLWVSRLEIAPDVAAWTRHHLAALPGLAQDFR